jgi:hypothetical protein
MLIVLGLARPVLNSKFAMATGGKAKRSVVIVIDNSYSMSYSGLQGTRFDIAKDTSLRILDSLHSGDNASLILMSDTPEVVFKHLTSDIQQVRDAVKNSRLSHRGTSIQSSMLEAYALLKESKNPQKHIYLLSDLGENGFQNWKSEQTILVPSSNGRTEPDDIETSIIRIGEENADNRAIENITLSSEFAGTGVPIQITANLVPPSNGRTELKGSSAGQTIAELIVDGENKGQANVVGNTVSFTHIFQKNGTHTGEIRLTSDRLPLDDTRYFAIDVLGQIKVLSVGDYKSYVNLALNPTGSSDNAFIMPANASTDGLSSESLDKYSVVILVDVAKLSDSAVRNLREFYLNGGNIIVFVGKSADRDWYNNNLSFLPASLGNRTTLVPPSNGRTDLVPPSNGRTEFTPKSLRISRWDPNHPIFSVFRDEGVANTLRTSEIYSAFSITPKSGANVISSFDKNIPAILESGSSNLVPPSNGRKEEKIGKVIMLNFSPDPHVSDVALRPMFLPLMQQTVLYLFSSGRDYEKNLLVGDIYSQNVYDKIDSAPMITDPEGKGTLATLTESNQAGIRKIGFDSTQRTGIYKIEFKSGLVPPSNGRTDGIAQRDYLAVNLNTTGESDLKSAKQDDIITKLGSQAQFVSLNNFEKTIESKTKSSDISPRLLILAILLMLLEIPLANRYKIKEQQDE